MPRPVFSFQNARRVVWTSRTARAGVDQRRGGGPFPERGGGGSAGPPEPSAAEPAECLRGISGPAGFWQRRMWEVGQAPLPRGENHYKYKPAWRPGRVSIRRRRWWTPHGGVCVCVCVGGGVWPLRKSPFLNTTLKVTRLADIAPYCNASVKEKKIPILYTLVLKRYPIKRISGWETSHIKKLQRHPRVQTVEQQTHKDDWEKRKKKRTGEEEEEEEEDSRVNWGGKWGRRYHTVWRISFSTPCWGICHFASGGFPGRDEAPRWAACRMIRAIMDGKYHPKKK